MELLRERAIASAGGAPESPGKMKEIKEPSQGSKRSRRRKNKE